jgi:cytochrome P450
MRRSSRPTVIPGPHGYPPWGIFPRLRRDPLQYLTALACRYGTVVSLPLGIRRAYLLAHPTHIQHVLQDQPDHSHKGVSVGRITPLFGEGLRTSEGGLWRRQRQRMQPLFQWPRLHPWTDVTAEATAARLARWEPLVARGQLIELAAALRELTQGLMGQMLFGLDPSPDAQAAELALTRAVGQLDRYVWAMVSAPRWLPIPQHRQLHRALHTLHAYVDRQIGEHSRPESTVDGLLARLLAVRDDTTGEGMSARQLRHEAVILWVAGQTTVAAALAWTGYLLAQHPEAASALQRELATVLDGRRPTSQDLPHLRYTRLGLAESLRLYPPTWVTVGTPSAADTIGSYALPAHAVLLLSPYVLQRHPAFWEHPEQFDPERLTPARAVGRPRFAYFPFGGGPWRCIGRHLAMLEMLTVLAMMAQAYKFHLVPGHPVEPPARAVRSGADADDDACPALRRRRHLVSQPHHSRVNPHGTRP